MQDDWRMYHGHASKSESTMILAGIAFVVGVVVGAFSHKWLASEVAKVPGGSNVLDAVEKK